MLVVTPGHAESAARLLDPRGQFRTQPSVIGIDGEGGDGIQRGEEDKADMNRGSALMEPRMCGRKEGKRDCFNAREM